MKIHIHIHHVHECSQWPYSQIFTPNNQKLEGIFKQVVKLSTQQNATQQQKGEHGNTDKSQNHSQ